YEMKGFNSLLGSHYDHYYIDYRDYDVDEIDQDVFRIDPSFQCSSFPGPGSRHFATFNPMKEFVHPVHDAHVDDEFERFKFKHNKQYASDVEHAKRSNIFRQNLRYEMKGFNSLLGSHYDHYYIDYRDYDVDEIDQDVFRIDPSFQCSSFPGPGSRHFATFNPMKEFVHPVHDAHVDDEFERFKFKHNKQYASDVEHAKRSNIFRQNLRYIHSNNRARRGFTLTVNHLADRTDDELAALRGRRYSGPNMGLPFPHSEKSLEELSDKVPAEHDWRLFGAVTPVKDQSVCGSCWSFGTVGAVEGALFMHNGGHLVRLSQQALVDCSWGSPLRALRER
ncbi:jg11407, partial [Pararge aegeria aegeria]